MSIAAYTESLRKLTSRELAKRTESLARNEQRVVARIVAHLAEIGRRKLQLDLGFGSLFDYCVRGLGLTEGSAYLRIQVANVCRRFPQLLAGLEAGTISLTVAGKLAPHLTAENHESLIESCSGMSKRQVDEYLTRTSPKPKVASGISRRPRRSESDNESSNGREFMEAKIGKARGDRVREGAVAYGVGPRVVAVRAEAPQLRVAWGSSGLGRFKIAATGFPGTPYPHRCRRDLRSRS